MPNRNTELENTIREFVQDNPGMTRSLIASNLQRSGIKYGKTHLSNRVGELVSFGSLSEQVTQDGRKLVFPPAGP
jgi:arginine repressor